VRLSAAELSTLTLGDLRGRLAAAAAATAGLAPLLRSPLGLVDYHEGLDDSTCTELGIRDGSTLALAAACPDMPPPLAYVVVIRTTADAGHDPEPAPPPRQQLTSARQRQHQRQLPFAVRQAIGNASLVLDPWLFVSGDQAARSKGALKALGIAYVLNCCERIPFAFENGRTENLLLAIPDQRDASLRPHLAEAFAFLDRARASGLGCLVHCMVGASRSVTVVLAWLMEREGMALCDAWALIKEKRSVARPNKGFALQLMQMERERNNRGQGGGSVGAARGGGGEEGGCTVQLEAFDKRYTD